MEKANLLNKNESKKNKNMEGYEMNEEANNVITVESNFFDYLKEIKDSGESLETDFSPNFMYL